MSRSVDDDTVVVATDAQLSAAVGNEQVILHRDSGVYYGVNEVGRRIWELVQEPRRVAGVRETILEEYDVEPEQCDEDVRGFLGDLLEADLVEVYDDPDG